MRGTERRMLWLDIETYSRVNLKKSNVYRYVEDDDFEILMCAWTTDGEYYDIALGEGEILMIPGLDDPNVIKVAHNAPFERICLSRILDRELSPEEFRDTRALAAVAGLPQSLEHCAKALGCSPKDTAGAALINFFCKPFRGRRRRPEDDPEKWQQFIDYCIQDVRTLFEIDELLPELTPTEFAVLMADQRINDRGVLVDVDLAEAAHETAELNKIEKELEFINLTGVRNPNSTQQVQAWLRLAGSPLPDLTADTVAAALQGSLTGPVAHALRLRQHLALTSSGKYDAALRNVCADGRLRGAFFYRGAHTGRWAGRGVQLHNLARAMFTKIVDGEEVWDECAENAAILDVLFANEATAADLKKLVRSMFIIDGCVVDYSAIEARIIAWLAGETWVLRAFEQGRDIYVETAQKMGGYTRSQGKVAVLALGFQGAVNSLRVMGAEGTDQELVRIVKQYRKANPKIVSFWYGLEKVFITGGQQGRIRVTRKGKDRIVHLPSGRDLVYHDVRRYDGRLTFQDPKGMRTDTYGGKLTENVTQATAADILGEGLVRLEAAGHRVVLHVHDEVAVEHSYDVDEVGKIMCEQPKWAKGLPLAAEGFVTTRYRKG